MWDGSPSPHATKQTGSLPSVQTQALQLNKLTSSANNKILCWQMTGENNKLYFQNISTTRYRIAKVVREMGISAQNVRDLNANPKPPKIPDYAKDYKSEFLFIRGIDRCFGRILKEERLFTRDLFENKYPIIKNILEILRDWLILIIFQK